LSDNSTLFHQLLSPICRTDFERLASQHHQGQRLRPKSVYSVIKTNDTRNIQGVIADEVIQLDSEHAKKRGAPKLRRIEYYDAKTKKTFQFLTNQFQLAALQNPTVLGFDRLCTSAHLANKLFLPLLHIKT
jgi:hypothetical protein